MILHETLLKINNLKVHYGGVKALDGADVHLNEGEIVALITDKTRVNQASGALEGAYFVQYDVAKEYFQKAYKAKFKKEAGITADNAYDAVYLYKQAIEDAGTTDLNKVKKVMNSYETFSGASGDLKFDGKGGVTKPPVFWEVKEGEFVKVEG